MSDPCDILVLGGTGPIGRALQRAADGRRVLAVGRREPAGVDVGDASVVERRIAEVNPRALVYLVNDRAASPERAVADLAHVVRVAAGVGVERLIFASSAAVYGDTGVAPYGEDATLAGASEYALTKIGSETEVARAAAEFGISALSLRIFNLFGAACHNSLVNQLAFGPPPRLLVTRGFVRDYVHVDDVAAALFSGIDAADVSGAVNIARGLAVDNVQLAAAAGAGAFEAVEGTDVVSFSVADVSRAERELGWTAQIDPLDALRRRSDRLD